MMAASMAGGYGGGSGSGHGHGSGRGGGEPPVMFVSKDHNLHADMYMESDAEEIYMPDGASPGRRGRNKRISTTTEDDSGVIGYQKYLHIVNRLAQDNTDGIEPHQP